MARILSGGGKITGKYRGLPGGNWKQTINKFTGNRVPKDKASRRGVRILQRSDPANAKTIRGAILGFTNNSKVPNMNSAPSPTIKRAPTTAVRGAGLSRQTATPKGVKRIVNRSANRSLKKR